MSPVIPFRRRSFLPSLLIALGAVAVLVIGFVATMIFLSRPFDFTDLRKGAQSIATHFENFVGPAVQYIGVDQSRVEILRPTQPGQIDVIDGDTVRFNGAAYRLVGFDTPERGDKARCDAERRLAEAATNRLRVLVAGGEGWLIPVACSCRPGQEGKRKCNYGRLCGSLLIGGRDAGNILIGEGLAHSYVCSATRCPQRRPWC